MSELKWISPLYELPKDGQEVLICIQTIGAQKIFPAMFYRTVGWVFTGVPEFNGKCIFQGSTEFVLAWSCFEWPKDLIVK